VVAAVVVVAVLLRIVSTPQGVWLGELIGLVWTAAPILYGSWLLLGKLRRRAPTRFRPQSLALGLATFAVGAALLVDGPFLVRWELSEDAFEGFVAEAPQANGAEWELLDAPDRIGSVDVRAAWALPTGGVMFDTGMAVFDDAGIGWFPDGPPRIASDGFGQHEDTEFTHFRGPWYLWTASW
jgi:hypothetical protein